MIGSPLMEIRRALELVEAMSCLGHQIVESELLGYLRIVMASVAVEGGGCGEVRTSSSLRCVGYKIQS